MDRVDQVANLAIAEAVVKTKWALEEALLNTAYTPEGRGCISKDENCLVVNEVVPPDPDEELGYWTSWRIILKGEDGQVRFCTPGALLPLPFVRILFFENYSTTTGLPHIRPDQPK